MTVELAALPGGEDWLLLPVLEGLCRYESLKDGTLDLADVALMNDALLVRSENRQRLRRAQENE
ncbi:DUF6889 family protein [Pseudomonas tohonis]|uniref:DUF6889 family protein n=1 Tax=Pseudomonas tohonis TaxID=2725477 RepID=UPI001F187D87|nr:hypothetical protein [Pseudomonas tohonis]